MMTRTKDGKSLRFLSMSAKDFQHGTRARYVLKCRCELCRAANRAVHKKRVEAVRAAAAEVTPNGPPVDRVLIRGRKKHLVKACTGTVGKPCIRGGAWLRDPVAQKAGVCLACVERAMVWNGLVPSDEVRRHLLALREKGIGYKTVAVACDASHAILHEIIMGRCPRIRAQTARRILDVDEGARAGHSSIDSDNLIQNVRWLRAEGFTMIQLAQLLGYESRTGVYTLLKCARRSGVVLASNDLKVTRLCNRVEAGELSPAPSYRVPAGPTRRLVKKLRREGFNLDQLTARVGMTMQSVLRSRKVKRTTAEKVRAFHDQVMAGGTPEKMTQRDAAVMEISKHLDLGVMPVDRDRVRAEAEEARIRRRLLAAYADGVEIADMEERFGKTAEAIRAIAARAGVARAEERAEVVA